MRKPAAVVVGLLAVSAAGAGAYWWLEMRHIESTDDAYLHSNITPVASKIAGYVATVAVTDNQTVQSGDILARIEDTELRAKAEEARAAVEARRSALGNLDSRTAWQKTVIAQVEAEAGAAGAELERARRELDRLKPLAERDYASRQRLDTAQADMSKAEAGIARARARIATERAQLIVLDSERQQANALLRQAEAALKVAVTALDDTVIRAPLNGVVGNRSVQVGQYVRPGLQLMAIVPLQDVWVEANFKETQLARMRRGQAVEVRLDAYPGLVLEGHIDSLAPASGAKFSLLPPENATGNFTKVVQRVPVKITLPAEAAQVPLRPGLSAVVAIDTRAPGSGPLTAVAAPTPRN